MRETIGLNSDVVRIGRFLSLLLRHRPSAIGLALDPQGWADIDELVRLANLAGRTLSREVVKRVVEGDDHARFVLSGDRRRIRANHGHSIPVDLDLVPLAPPEVLYHGTTSRFIDSIRNRGLLRGRRAHVHLSQDVATATRVGARRGTAIVLTVAAGRMHRDSFEFYRSVSGVWLTEHVPAEYLLALPLG